MKTRFRDRSRARALTVLIAAVLLAAAHGAAIAGPAAPAEGTTAPTSSDLKEAFEAEFRLFLAAPLYLPGPYDPLSSRGPEYSPEALTFERQMKGMGPGAIPLLMDKLRELRDTQKQIRRAEMLAYCVHFLSRHWLVDLDWPGGKPGGRAEAIPLLFAWWDAGQKGTTERFEKLYSEWNRLKVRQSLLSVLHRDYVDHIEAITTSPVEVTEMGKVFESITGLGLGALPPMMERLRGGDYGVLPFIAEITGEEATPLSPDLRQPIEERARLCLEWWDKNKEQWTVPFPDVVALPAAREAATAQDANAPAPSGAAVRPLAPATRLQPHADQQQAPPK
jgi:hypothetical protein